MDKNEAPYSYDELLFARKVREVAHALRDQGAPKLRGWDEEDQSEFELSKKEREAWLAENPSESFYEDIVNHAMLTADAIRGIISSKND